MSCSEPQPATALDLERAGGSAPCEALREAPCRASSPATPASATHRRIAHIAGPQDHADSAGRLKGYGKALEEAGIAFDANLVCHAGFHEPDGEQAINRLLEARQSFTAVFASSDQAGYGARLALYRHDLRVPEDVSLIGFDDLPASRYAVPPLSTIHRPVYELGQAAARVLLELIEGGTGRVTLPDPQLVARDSTQRLRT